MSRALRRAEDAAFNRFKRKAGANGIDTFCGEPATLAGHPHEQIFRRAVGDLYQRAHSLTCIVCREAMCSQRPISAVLLACKPRSPSSVSASAICLTCWTPDDLTLIEEAGERVLGKIVAGGKFEPMEKQTARSTGMPGGP